MSEDFSKNVTLADFLAADARPSFVIELESQYDGSWWASSQKPPYIVYSNPALSDNDALSDAIVGPSRACHIEFWRWITTQLLPCASSSMLFLDVYWTRTLVQTRWVIVSGNAQPETRTPPTHSSTISISPDEKHIKPSIMMSAARHTAESSQHPPENQIQVQMRRAHTEPAGSSEPEGRGNHRALNRGSPMASFIEQRLYFDIIKTIDWASTPLGPIKTWHPRLEEAFNSILADSRSLAIYWGSAYTTLYNEAFSALCGRRHPDVLGKPVEELWPEEGVKLKEKMRESAKQLRPSYSDELEWGIFVENVDGTLKETYLKWSIIPIIDNGDVLGFMHSVVETTSMRLWERRMKMLVHLGEVLVTARDAKSYWKKALEDLEAVEPRYDIPLAILYSVSPEEGARDGGSPRHTPVKVCHLEGSLGIPVEHPIAPARLHLQKDTEGLAAAFRQALGEHSPISIQASDGTLPQQLLDGLEWRGFGEPCQKALVCPIRPTKDKDVMGILVLGLNPRRPYDNDYQQYISLLNQKLRTSLASTVLLEEETRRGRNAVERAVQDQAILKEKLDEQTKEATEFNRRFEAVAQFIPVGMCFGDDQGNITFANDAWYRITGIQPASSAGSFVSAAQFLERIVEEDRSTVIKVFESLQKGLNATFEFRVKKQHGDESELVTPLEPATLEKAGISLARPDNIRVVLATAKAELSPHNSRVIRILTCLTDVTLHRQTAEEAVRRAQQAENLKRMAEFATVGMYDMDLEGRLIGANHVFYEMCGIQRVADPEGREMKPFHDCVAEEDMNVLKETLARLVDEGKTQTAEIRFKNPWSIEDGESGVRVVAPRWVLATFMPVRSAEGVIRSFTGCLSDVSLQKWQLDRERQRKEEAIQSKRQQDLFIDMTSHEMRNPLSAITMCADDVISSLTKFQAIEQGLTAAASSGPSSDEAREESPLEAEASSLVLDPGSQANRLQLIKNLFTSAEIIVLSAQHQKRIADDILTMSKLDSKLLPVTPVTADPVRVVQESLKMFEVEARSGNIELSMAVDPSYRDLGIQFLDFDPSRVMQVLINLLTNAIKFTKGSGPTRTVSVSISASRSRPTEATSGVQFVPRTEELPDQMTEEAGWHEDSSDAPQAARQAEKEKDQPDEEEQSTPSKSIFVMLEVKDTGQGLNEEERKILFQRFVQASSQTHVTHGGSGLGLFISRRLTEMQNGAIGVTSSPGVGSTFAFYIEAVWPKKEAGTVAGAPGPTREMLMQYSIFPYLAMPVPDHVPIKGILVVEDNITNQKITHRLLTGLGYAVDVANHGLEALEKLKRSSRFVGDDSDRTTIGSTTAVIKSTGASSLNGLAAAAVTAAVVAGAPPPPPEAHFELDIILMDVEMPFLDGLACTREIRRLEELGKIVSPTGRLPIMAVSANARYEQLVEAKEAGFDAVMVKPFHISELVDRMKLVVAAGTVRKRPVAKGPVAETASTQSASVDNASAVESTS